MKVSEIIKKPVVEAKYLNVDNADRYRPIIRLFYLKYEKLKYWLYQEEVFEELKEDTYFAGYTIEQCKQDLNTLTEWGNLLAMQDTRRAATLEEFANKKFRYQLSETAVEIERMVIRIENLFIESSSLEPSLLERLRMSLAGLPSMLAENDEKLYSYWNDLNNDFKRLNQNYQDYMRELNSVKAENLMRTKEFLIFKDRLIEYLRNFVKGLQTNVGIIETIIKGFDETMLQSLINRIFQYELSIPRLETVVDEERILDNINGRFESLKDWFVSDGNKESEVVKVFDTTNEIIRKITGYAARISESGGSSANRKEEYKKLAEVFYNCEDICEAHRFAGLVFGTATTFHLRGIGERQTESINSGVYEEETCIKIVTPRVRNYREKAKRSEIKDNFKAKEELRLATIEKLAAERELLRGYIKDGRRVFKDWPEITPFVRDVFLTWISRALENKEGRGKTEEGKRFRLISPTTEEICELKSEDGVLYMPSYEIIFEDEVNESIGSIA